MLRAESLLHYFIVYVNTGTVIMYDLILHKISALLQLILESAPYKAPLP